KLLQIARLRAFEVERLQFLGGEGDELAATVFVAFDYLRLIDLLTRSGIMRLKRDPGGGGALVSIKAGIVGEEPRCRWRRTLLPATQIREVVFVYIDRRWLPHLCKRKGFVRVVAGDK